MNAPRHYRKPNLDTSYPVGVATTGIVIQDFDAPPIVVVYGFFFAIRGLFESFVKEAGLAPTKVEFEIEEIEDDPDVGGQISKIKYDTFVITMNKNRFIDLLDGSVTIEGVHDWFQMPCERADIVQCLKAECEGDPHYSYLFDPRTEEPERQTICDGIARILVHELCHLIPHCLIEGPDHGPVYLAHLAAFYEWMGIGKEACEARAVQRFREIRN